MKIVHDNVVSRNEIVHENVDSSDDVRVKRKTKQRIDPAPRRVFRMTSIPTSMQIDVWLRRMAEHPMLTKDVYAKSLAMMLIFASNERTRVVIDDACTIAAMSTAVGCGVKRCREALATLERAGFVHVQHTWRPGPTPYTDVHVTMMLPYMELDELPAEEPWEDPTPVAEPDYMPTDWPVIEAKETVQAVVPTPPVVVVEPAVDDTKPTMTVTDEIWHDTPDGTMPASGECGCYTCRPENYFDHTKYNVRVVHAEPRRIHAWKVDEMDALTAKYWCTEYPHHPVAVTIRTKYNNDYSRCSRAQLNFISMYPHVGDPNRPDLRKTMAEPMTAMQPCAKPGEYDWMAQPQKEV